MVLDRRWVLTRNADLPCLLPVTAASAVLVVERMGDAASFVKQTCWRTGRDSREEPEQLQYIKLDVEGHEEQVLKGASELISASKPTIAFEGHYKQYPDQ